MLIIIILFGLLTVNCCTMTNKKMQSHHQDKVIHIEIVWNFISEPDGKVSAKSINIDNGVKWLFIILSSVLI